MYKHVLDTLAKSDLVLRKGCEVLLKRIAKKHFIGKTLDKSCESTLRGSSYATGEVEIIENEIISWDRGFDSLGNQVWGAVKGGYIFNKFNP